MMGARVAEKLTIRDRVVELRRVKASELAPSPLNWRRHPNKQKEVLTGLLKEIGYAGALLARQTPDGLQLIDGHLRRELTPDAEVPVLVLDVNEAEAAKLLATFDPVSALAEADAATLNALLKTVSTGEAAVQALLAELAAANGIGGAGAVERAEPTPIVQYTIIFDDEAQQTVWFDYLKWLKAEYPGDTIAARLAAHLKDQVL